MVVPPDSLAHFFMARLFRWLRVDMEERVNTLVNPYDIARKIPKATLNRSLVILARPPDMMAVLS